MLQNLIMNVSILRRPLALGAATVLLLLGLGGCGADPACVAGATAPCTCTDGGAGAQTCKADGSGLAACVCSGGGADVASDATADVGDDVGQNDATVGPADTAGCSCAAVGAQCGFLANCAASCGACPSGKKCEANKCVVGSVGVKKVPFGGACGPTKECVFPAAGSAQGAYDAYYDCIDDECEDGRCRNGVCIKQCVMSKDSVHNASGKTGSDGVEDPKESSECDDAIDGPYGDSFRCVEFRAPADVLKGSSSAFCYPGKTWKPCGGSAECDAKESCQLRYVFGQYGTYCVPKLKPADNKAHVGLTASCNTNPFLGEVETCDSNWCSSTWGCRAFCKDDNDCVTSVGACAGGVCTNQAGKKSCAGDADCSAQMCKKGLKYYSNVEQTFNMCYPKTCALTTDCPDGSGCRLNSNGVTSPSGDPDPDNPKKVIMPGWSNLCLPHKTGGVKAGELCDIYPSDANADDPFCENPSFCRDGFCGNLCVADTDCATNMKCGATEFGFDTDDDGLYDYRIASDLCVGLPGKGTDCDDNSDCAATQACKPWLHKTGSKLPGGLPAYTSSGSCIDKIPGRAQYASYCGAGKDGVQCQTDVCLSVFSGQNYGICSDACDSRFDCPAKVKIGNFTYKSLCSSRWEMGNQTLLDPNDDVYAPVCWPSADANSLEDCAATRKCTLTGEACSARVITRGPDTAAKVEYICTRVNGSSDPAPDKNVGDPCDPEGDVNPCKGGMCLEDIKAGTGYCSALCLGDDDCGGAGKGIFCDLQRQQIPRLDAKKAAVVPICMKKSACLPCTYDNHCPTGSLCSNVGGPQMHRPARPLRRQDRKSRLCRHLR
jgi:hypothetical protein